MFFTPELLSRRDSGFGLLWWVTLCLPKSRLNRRKKAGCYLGAQIILQETPKAFCFNRRYLKTM